MSRLLHKLLAASALAVGTTSAFAEDTARSKDAPPTREGQSAPRPEHAELFKRLDADGDGKLAVGDVPEEHRRLFERLVQGNDKDKDGKLTLDEFSAGLVQENRRGEESRRDAGPGAGPGPGPGDGPRRDGREGEVRRPFPGSPVLLALDANRDGELSAEEIAAASSELRKLDKNGDGKLTHQEIAPQPPMEGGPRGVGPDGPRPGPGDILKSRDANGDGKLSKEEAPDRMKEHFERIDANKDGFVDETELRQAFAGAGRGDAGPPREGGPGERRKPDGERGPGERKPDGEPSGERREAIMKDSDERFKAADKDGNGKLSKEEVPEKVRDNFSKIDQNGDGGIDPGEMREAGRRLGGGKTEGDRPKERGVEGKKMEDRKTEDRKTIDKNDKNIDKKPEDRKSIDKNSEGKFDGRKPTRDGDAKDGAKDGEKREERKKDAGKDESGKKEERVKKDDAPSKDDAPKKDDAPRK
ncbi:MAG: hypothetical protein K8U03_07885 [Planctomycetia bacterium]|nr:hypothetical protein [Planctomycetia bacterium]